MHLYRVGEPYIVGRSAWPEAVEYNYRSGEHELRMFLRAPTPREIEAVRTGDCAFALAAEGPVIFLLYRFGDSISWSDAPSCWHLVPETERALPESEGPETRALLHVILVDADSGIIRALRVVSFSPTFTRALHVAIRQQATSPWPGRAAYDAALAEIYRQYPTTAHLLARTLAVSRGGE